MPYIRTRLAVDCAGVHSAGAAFAGFLLHPLGAVVLGLAVCSNRLGKAQRSSADHRILHQFASARAGFHGSVRREYRVPWRHLIDSRVASRFTGLVLSINMFVAYWTADREALKSIFSDPGKFYLADPYTFLFASLMILIFGAGLFSLDKLIQSKVAAYRESDLAI